MYSATLWVRVTAALLWCGCLFRLVPVDKIVGAAGACCPHLSLYITILLRLAPWMGCRAPGIRETRTCLGRKTACRRGCGGRHGADLGTGQPGGAARSMTCRGLLLRHRTSYACRWMGHGDRVLLTVESWEL